MSAQDLFQTAVVAFQRGDLANADRLTRSLLDEHPQHADGLHLAAIIARQQGRALQAVEFFENSLGANPNQPVVLSNFGNCLRDLNRRPEAESMYRLAVKMMPTLVDAWYHRGILALETLDLALARHCLTRALELKAEARTYLALGRLELEAAQPAIALQHAHKMRSLWPRDARAVALEARALRAQNPATDPSERDQRTDTVRKHLQMALDEVDDPAALYYELGLSAYDQDEIETAIDAFEQALARRPDLIDAHRALNHLLWQRQSPQFLRSYLEALPKLPDHAPLYHNLAAAYISSGQEQEATRTLEYAVERLGRDPYLLHALGVQAVKHENFALAGEFYDEALRVSPDTVRFLIDRATLDIRLSEYARAQPHLERALKIAPLHQEVWAYLGLIWRLTDDTRHDWLNDYPRFLREYELPTPQGFASTAEFMQTLAAYLQTRHTHTRQPLDQSVRNGTQTTGVLLDDPHPLLQALKASMGETLREYLATLAHDPTHPFLSRLKSSARFAGSWSVSLGAQGFHVNHVHPLGWLSCCNYIALPDVIHQGDQHSGWIKFGESALALGEREHIARVVEPQVGHVVFFPGYFWHGTIPFNSVDRRLTVPCDFEPT